VHRLADEVEQNIRNIQVLSVITPEDAERLIDELVELIQGVH